RHLQLRVIAEGIETYQQLQRMRELGCRFGQGFLFARPMSEDAYRHWTGVDLQPPETEAGSALELEGAQNPPG
ncbi:EAL domain-containing protein, partial [Pseudomonas citronellolis]